MSRTSTATRSSTKPSQPAEPDIRFWWAEATATGLVPDETAHPTFLQWQADGERLLRLDKRLPWLIGDWINYGEARWGERYAQAMDATSYSYSRLSTFSSVCRAIEYARRHPKVSFGHHEVVAPLVPAQQDEWLAEVEKRKLSVEDLRQAIAGRPMPSDGEWYWLEKIIHLIARAEREVGSIRLTETGVGPVLKVAKRRLERALDQVKSSRRS